MKAIKLFTLFILVILTFTNCRKDLYDTRLVFENNSDYSIYFTSADLYKDTNYVYVHYDIGNAPFDYKINPHETKSHRIIGPWERVYEEKDTVAFYVFDANILETTPWDTVKANYLVLKRYDLSLQDLIDMNWTITYP